MPVTKYVEFKDVTISVYVRTGPSAERIQYFQDLYTSSAAGTIPPMQITQDNKLIDGRNRLAALKGLDELGAVFEVIQCADSFDITMAALRANVGGPKELTLADIRRNIIRLIDEGYTVKKIVGHLPFPKEMARREVKSAVQQLRFLKLNAAAHAVTAKEITLEEAIKKYKLPREAIQKAISKRQRDEEKLLTNVGGAKGIITQRYYGMTAKMTKFFKTVSDRYEAGEFTEAQVLEIVAHALHQARNHVSSITDWEDRFKVLLRTRAPFPAGPIPKKKLEVGPASTL